MEWHHSIRNWLRVLQSIEYVVFSCLPLVLTRNLSINENVPSMHQIKIYRIVRPIDDYLGGSGGGGGGGEHDVR